MLVTHDRFMLDRLSTELLALDGSGHAKAYASYPQYLNAQKKLAATKPDASDAPAPPVATPNTALPKTSGGGGKLTYKLQRELDGMEAAILAAEQNLTTLEEQAADPKVMANHERHAQVCEKLGTAHTLVETLYTRWAELEQIAAN